MAKAKKAESTDQVVDPKKAERKARSVAKRAAKKEALKKVLSFVKETGGDQFAAEVKLLTPGARFGGGVRTGKADVIAEAFMNESQINENQIWDEYKLGRREMRGICINLIKKRSPENRMWISFDSESGIYTLEAIGEKAPAGWTGYEPVDVDDIDL
jgi:hypothetical protein